MTEYYSAEVSLVGDWIMTARNLCRWFTGTSCL